MSVVRYGLVSLALLIVVASVANACQVPVFRYALERWVSDRYEFVVIHPGDLSDNDTQAIEGLRRTARNRTAPVNCSVRVVKAGELKDKQLVAAWNQHKDRDSPLFAAMYPEGAKDVPDRLISTTALSDLSIENVIDSPVRQTLKKRLLAGQSAVWIFVPSGDETKDKPAFESLQRELKKNETNLKLPVQDEIENVEELLEQVDIELRLEFSILRLERDDPRERFFLEMLLASEPDLEELNEAMAFPVLGRGRVLYALVGNGINESTVAEASRFIIGPCSCQVKNQNPGFDLLMRAGWDAGIGKTKLSDPLPEISDEPILLTIPPGRKSK